MINSYSFGNITIDHQKFTKDLIIFPGKISEVLNLICEILLVFYSIIKKIIKMRI